MSSCEAFHYCNKKSAVYKTCVSVFVIPTTSNVSPLSVSPRLAYYKCNSRMSVGEMSVGEMSVGEVSVGEMSVGEMSWIHERQVVGMTGRVLWEGRGDDRAEIGRGADDVIPMKWVSE